MIRVLWESIDAAATVPGTPWIAEIDRQTGVDDVEYATLTWVDWFNNRRLFGPNGHVPPAEYETAYYRRRQALADAA